MKSIWQRVRHKHLCFSLTRLALRRYLALMLSDIEVSKNTFFQRPLILFQKDFFSLYQTTKDFLAFIKTAAGVFVVSIIIAPFKND